MALVEVYDLPDGAEPTGELLELKNGVVAQTYVYVDDDETTEWFEEVRYPNDEIRIFRNDDDEYEEDTE